MKIIKYNICAMEMVDALWLTRTKSMIFAKNSNDFKRSIFKLLIIRLIY